MSAALSQVSITFNPDGPIVGPFETIKVADRQVVGQGSDGSEVVVAIETPAQDGYFIVHAEGEHQAGSKWAGYSVSVIGVSVA